MIYADGQPVAEFVPEIADNLTTDDSTKALSAKQGKVLNEKLDELEVVWDLSDEYWRILAYKHNKTCQIKMIVQRDMNLASSGLVTTIPNVSLVDDFYMSCINNSNSTAFRIATNGTVYGLTTGSNAIKNGAIYSGVFFVN